MKKQLVSCPVSIEKVNETVARIIALFAIVLLIIAVYFNLPLLTLVLALDFSLRTFSSAKYSPLKYAGRRFSNYLGLHEKLVDAAPKKFAAGIGMVFTFSIAGLQWLDYPSWADLLAVILLLFAGLESFKGICVGCIIYTYVAAPLLPKENSQQSSISINL